MLNIVQHRQIIPIQVFHIIPKSFIHYLKVKENEEKEIVVYHSHTAG